MIQRIRNTSPHAECIINTGSSLSNGLLASIRPTSSLLKNDMGNIYGGSWTQSGNVPGFSSPIGESWGQLSTNGGLYGPITNNITAFTVGWYGIVAEFQSSFPFISQMTPESNATRYHFLRFGDAGLDKGKVQLASSPGLSGNTICPTGVPLMIFGVSTGTECQIWINGILDVSSSVSLASLPISLGFGYSAFGARGLNGWHAWMGAWNRPLSPSEIQSISIQPWILFGLPPVHSDSSRIFRGWGIPV